DPERRIARLDGAPPSHRSSKPESAQSFVASQSVELTQAWSFGGLAVLHQAWQSFALDRLFSGLGSSGHAGLLKAMVFGRILFPSAKLALVDQARGTLLAAACGLDQASENFDEDDLYEAMDQLNGQWVAMEKQLYAQSFPQGVSL